jgi:hypothetical protein
LLFFVYLILFVVLDVGEECVGNYDAEEGSEYYAYYDEDNPCQYGYRDAA